MRLYVEVIAMSGKVNLEKLTRADLFGDQHDDSEVGDVKRR